MAAPHPALAPLARQGLLFILSSPSGAGKSTIAARLLADDPAIAMSVSVTTRPPRPGESDGREYHFVDAARFDRLVADDALLEHATVFGNRYGTLRKSVNALRTAGRDVLFDIDWQGAQQLRQRAGADVVPVFILPPSIAALRARLAARATDSDAVIDARMARARDEISHWDGYDFVVINDDIGRCCAEVKTILAAERLRRTRQIGLVEFTRTLMATPGG